MTLNFVAFKFSLIFILQCAPVHLLSVRTTEAEQHTASCPAYSWRRVYPTSIMCAVMCRGCSAAIFW